MSFLPRAHQQGAKSHLIALLRKETLDLKSAKNELRWLGEHVKKLHPADKKASQEQKQNHKDRHADVLLKLCERRSRAEPLQYILKSQPFGSLEIQCRRGVLIPRPETEAYTTYLASKICNGLLAKHFDILVKRARARSVTQGKPQIEILDACSGSGCISLLLYKLLSTHIKTFGNLHIEGADISVNALRLSNENLSRNIIAGHLEPTAASEVAFINKDVLKEAGLVKGSTQPKSPKSYHIIVSNPPYISQEEYATRIPRSVRDWEPKRALVPPSSVQNTSPNTHPADVFYLALIKQYQATLESFMLVMEIGNEAQAKRVLEMAREHDLHETSGVSVWRDSPDVRPSAEDLAVNEMSMPTEGQGNVRAVVFVRHLALISSETGQTAVLEHTAEP